MEEKILLESESYKWFHYVTISVALISLLVGIVFFANYHTTSTSYYPYLHTYDVYDDGMLVGGIICLCVSVISFLLFFMTYGTKITVSNTRVSGKAMFGKQVDIPLDSVSAVGKFSLWRGVSVSSSSGNIRFLLLEYSEAIFEVVGQQLQQRIKEQKNKNDTFSGSSIEDLKKYKDLYDAGVITSEEFEAKKKQILGL